ncbi:MAG: hypothetical protein V1900_00355 [Candidatus Aenigmatarchaeota archaeon]
MNKTFEKLVVRPFFYMLESPFRGASRALDGERTPISREEIAKEYHNKFGDGKITDIGITLSLIASAIPACYCYCEMHLFNSYLDKR